MRQVHNPQLDTRHNTERCDSSPEEDIDDRQRRMVQSQGKHSNNQCKNREIDHERWHQLPVRQPAADDVAERNPHSE